MELDKGTTATNTSRILGPCEGFVVVLTKEAKVTNVQKPSLIAILAMALVICGCPFVAPKATAKLSNLTLCQGWDTSGNLIVLPDVVPPDETRICICGHLETNREILLQIDWYRDGGNVLLDRQVFDNGGLLHCVEDDSGFEAGVYTVVVVMGKQELGRVDFSIPEGADL